MKRYSNHQVLKKAENKYILSKVIAKKARELKAEEDISIGYDAINRAVEDLMEDKFSYKVISKKPNEAEE
ncbi:MAG: hypothetical protein GX079_04990 [Tissierellia bacterium]|nr:hypothetical protein [Tissierellia bacterium]